MKMIIIQTHLVFDEDDHDEASRVIAEIINKTTELEHTLGGDGGVALVCVADAEEATELEAALDYVDDMRTLN